MNVDDKMYRYVDTIALLEEHYDDAIWSVHEPTCEVYRVVRLTPRGCWVSIGYGCGERFIKNDARRKFAYPTKAEAIDSYMLRKDWQLFHCKRAYLRAKALYDYAQETWKKEKQE